MAQELTDINEANQMGFDGVTVSDVSGNGIKVDKATPTFGFRDITGQIVPRAGGGATPAFTAFRGSKVKEYAFGGGDIIDNITYHVPHDYAPNTDLNIHIHWGHNGAAISGNFGGNFYAMYSKGYNQAGQIFNSELTLPWTQSTPDVATIPRWSHNILEIGLSNAGGDATHIDTAKIEPDGIISIALDSLTIPSITGSAESNLPYIFEIDVHYQSTNIGTKNKDLPFYGV